MTTYDPTDPAGMHMSPPTRSLWYGWVAFAGTMLVLLGTFHAIAGLVALLRDDYYLVGSGGLVVTANYTAWGWTHLILGIVVAIAGAALFAGLLWARIVAIVVAMVSAIVNLTFLSAYPLWSVIMIALDVVIIYAVAVHGEVPEWE